VETRVVGTTMVVTTTRRMIDNSDGLAVGDIDYDSTAFSTADYTSNPNRVWQKIRRMDIPYGYKPGIDIQFPGA